MSDLLGKIKEYVERDEPYLICYYGNSTTQNLGRFPAWPDIISYVLKYEIKNKYGLDYKKTRSNIQEINLGMSGAHTQDHIHRVKKDVIDRNPQLVFYNTGVNDYGFGLKIEETEKNTRDVLNLLLENNRDVVFTSKIRIDDQSHEDNLKSYQELDKRVAEEFSSNKNFIFSDLHQCYDNVDLDKVYTMIMPGPNQAFGLEKGDRDIVHSNEYGNSLVAKFLLKDVFDIDFDNKLFLETVLDETVKWPQF